MNILFLTLLDFNSIEEHNIYTDLLREFYKEGHSVYVISPVERKKNLSTKYIKGDRVGILKLKIGNIQKTNIIEKGISTITLEGKFISAIKKYFADMKFDLVLYSTPPITLQRAVKYVKKRDKAVTYLMLKDIFPQNAVDMGMLSKSGIKGILYKYFRKKEEKLYRISDYIGCMSQANVDYVLEHNPEVGAQKLGICPNCIEPVNMSVTENDKMEERKKYDIPLDKIVFVYGGNLGKPQGISFLIECLKSQMNNDKVFFLIVGDGTEYDKVESFVNTSKQTNVKLLQKLPKRDYDKIVGVCDVGMIFLDYRFTIPNFPSRLLSYMQARIPVFAVTDRCTDIGKTIIEGQFGWWSESNVIADFIALMNEISCMDKEEMMLKGKNGWQYLLQQYTAKSVYETIIKRWR